MSVTSCCVYIYAGSRAYRSSPDLQLRPNYTSQGDRPSETGQANAALNQSTEHPEPDLSRDITLIFPEKGKAS